ncbi:MAG: TetR/AcrR family transcriptional regulator [Paludibacteraceae bacterium]|nr:TetR/AcrR family transcriptional regulator [Paludibacteraceae bacterium]
MSNDQRTEIIKAAGEMFFRLGIRSVSIDDICHELGMSKKTFYVYFGSKDELIEQLLQANIDYMTAKMDALLNAEDFRQVAKGLLKHCHEIGTNGDVRRVPQLVYDLKKYYSRQFEEFQNKSFEQHKSHIARLLERGLSNGFIRANLNIDLTSTILAKIYTDMLRDFEQTEAHGRSVMQLTHAAMDICIRGVLSEEGLKLYEE